MKQFLVTICIMALIPSILKCSYLTNSLKSFKFEINRVPSAGFLFIDIGETNSVDSWVVSLIIYLCNISSKITWISTSSSSGEKLGFFVLCVMGVSFSNSIVSHLTICKINLSDVSFCHSGICSANCPPWKFLGVFFKLTSGAGINISWDLLLWSFRTFFWWGRLPFPRPIYCCYTLIGSNFHFFSTYLSLLDL